MATKEVVEMTRTVFGGWTLTGWTKQVAGPVQVQVTAGRAIQTLVLVMMMMMTMTIPGIGRTGPIVETR